MAKTFLIKRPLHEDVKVKHKLQWRPQDDGDARGKKRPAKENCIQRADPGHQRDVYVTSRKTREVEPQNPFDVTPDRELHDLVPVLLCSILALG